MSITTAAADPAAADMLVGPKHLIERHRQQQQQQSSQMPDSKVQQQATRAKLQATKQTSLLSSRAMGTSVLQQQLEGPAGMRLGAQHAAGKQQGLHKVQVAKNYIVQLRKELPADSFKYACPSCALHSAWCLCISLETLRKCCAFCAADSLPRSLDSGLRMCSHHYA